MKSAYFVLLLMPVFFGACKPDDTWIFDELNENQREANRSSTDFDIPGAEQVEGPPPQMSPLIGSPVSVEGLAAPFQFVESVPFELVLRFAPEDAARISHLALWVEKATVHLRVPLTVDPETGIAILTTTLNSRTDRMMRQFNILLVPLDDHGDPGRSCLVPVWITAFKGDGPNRMRIHFSDPRVVDAVGFLPVMDGFEVLSAGDEGVVTSWRFEETSTRLHLTGHTARVLSVASTPDGARIVSGGQDHTVRLWDAQSGSEIAVREDHTDFVQAVVFDPAGAMLASGSWDGTVAVRNPVDGSHIRTLQAGDRVNDLAVSPDGAFLAAGLGLIAREGGIRIWETTTWDEIAAVSDLPGAVHSVAFSPDSLRLAAAYGRGTVGAWDTTSWARVMKAAERSDTVWDLVFHPDNPQFLAGVTLGGLFIVWDLSDEGEFMMAMATGISSRTLAISPDATVLVLGDNQGAARAYALPLSEIMGF